MRNPTYLALSRHGVYYFRFPAGHGSARTIRLSLQTRLPPIAMELARMLASVATAALNEPHGRTMSIDELRALMVRHFASYRIKHKERFAQGGPLPEEELETLDKLVDLFDRGRLADHWNQVGFELYLAERDLPVTKGSPDYEALRQEHSRSTIEHRRFVVEHDRQARTGADTTPPAKGRPSKVDSVAAHLTIDVLAKQHTTLHLKQGTWSASTAKERERHFALLSAIVGEDQDARGVTVDDARRVRDMLLDMPSNRNKKQATKYLTVEEQVAVVDAPKMQQRTIRKHLQTYHGLFAWAMQEQRVVSNPFEGIKVATNARALENTERQGFTREQLDRILRELTAGPSTMVTKDYQLWGPLIGIYSGARLNEICQLQIDDIKELDGIWCFDLNDEGDHKSLKTASAKRIVPVHSRLMELGLLAFVERVRATGHERLFSELKWDSKNKWGRALSRWFNDRLLVQLGIKSRRLAFHSLRHTMVTRLLQASVEEPLVKALVGHKAEGVTQATYFRAGHTVVQKRDAIELFR